MEEDYYWDDPVEEASERSRLKKLPTAILLIISLVATSFFLRTTLASNITMAASTLEFGQATALTASCAGNNNIFITAGSIFANATKAGSFKLDTITVSNIPQSCYGSDFTISLYPDSSNTPATLFYGATSITLYNNAGTFSTLSSASNYVNLSSSAVTCVGGGSCNSVKIDFNTPTLLTSNISKITLQSGSHTTVLSCASGGSCAIGETGPGGGFVYYYSEAGFNCGSAFSATGSPTGGLCHYLEVSRKNWNGGSDPSLNWSTAGNSTTDVSGITNETVVNNSLAAIGLGYQNSVAIVNQGNNNTTAAGLARSYTYNGLSDWYLPDSTEINLLCQWSNGLTLDPTTACTGSQSTLNSGIYAAQNANISAYRYWASSEYNASNVWTLHFSISPSQSSYGKTFVALGIRPIRAF